MRVKKEQLSIKFIDGTSGTITTETITGRVDVKAEYADVRVYYYTEHVNNQWVVKRCNEGFCYDAVIIAEKETRKEAIAEIILDVRKNQVRTARTYILTTVSGREFEVVATSEHLAKKCVRFECAIKEENLITKEIKKADEIKQLKARIGPYADFINEFLPTPSDEPKTEEEEEEEAENEYFIKQMTEPETESQIKDECLIDGINFMILWTTEIMFHVYLDDKCIGHGEICRSKLGFMYDCEEYNGFIRCDVENLEMKKKRIKIMDCMIEYYKMRGGEEVDG